MERKGETNRERERQRKGLRWTEGTICTHNPSTMTPLEDDPRASESRIIGPDLKSGPMTPLFYEPCQWPVHGYNRQAATSTHNFLDPHLFLPHHHHHHLPLLPIPSLPLSSPLSSTLIYVKPPLLPPPSKVPPVWLECVWWSVGATHVCTPVLTCSSFPLEALLCGL